MSHALALVITAGLGTVLFVTSVDPEPVHSESPAIQVTLEQEPSPPTPTPPPPEPPKEPRPVHREHHQPPALPLMAAVAPTPTEDFPASDAPQNPIAEPAPPRVAATSGTLEAQYAATLRTNIDSRTAPPVSAEYRLLKPHGEARVSFTLERSGALVDCRLARNSGSNLLDRHALSIVQTGRYPPFPSDAFPGETRHSFLITLEFHL